VKNANMIAQQMLHPTHCSQGRLVVASLMNTSEVKRNPARMNNVGFGDEASAM
jgi:hypothetical protein